MLAEPLAVIRRDGEQRLRLEAKTLERIVQLTDERIGVGHLAVVRPIAISRRVRFGRLVRIVRLEQVNPQEDAVGRALAFEPRRSPRAACRRPASAACSGCRRSGSSETRRCTDRIRARIHRAAPGRSRTRTRRCESPRLSGFRRGEATAGARPAPGCRGRPAPTAAGPRRSWRGTGASAGRGPSRWPHTPPRARSDRVWASDPRRCTRRRGPPEAYRW